MFSNELNCIWSQRGLIFYFQFRNVSKCSIDYLFPLNLWCWSTRGDQNWINFPLEGTKIYLIENTVFRFGGLRWEIDINWRIFEWTKILHQHLFFFLTLTRNNNVRSEHKIFLCRVHSAYHVHMEPDSMSCSGKLASFSKRKKLLVCISNMQIFVRFTPTRGKTVGLKTLFAHFFLANFVNWASVWFPRTLQSDLFSAWGKDSFFKWAARMWRVKVWRGKL